MGTLNASSVKSLAVEINDAAETLKLTLPKMNAVLAKNGIHHEVWVWPEGAGESTSGYQLGIAQCGVLTRHGSAIGRQPYELAVRYCEIEKGEPDGYGGYQLNVVPGSCGDPIAILHASIEEQTQMISQIAELISELENQMGYQLRAIEKGTGIVNELADEFGIN